MINSDSFSIISGSIFLNSPQIARYEKHFAILHVFLDCNALYSMDILLFSKYHYVNERKVRTHPVCNKCHSEPHSHIVNPGVKSPVVEGEIQHILSSLVVCVSAQYGVELV